MVEENYLLVAVSVIWSVFVQCLKISPGAEVFKGKRHRREQENGKMRRKRRDREGGGKILNPPAMETGISQTQKSLISL